YVDVAERLQPPAELRSGTPHALRDRADAAVVAGEQRDDPVGLAELLHPQHHGVVAVELPPEAASGHQKPRRRSCVGSRCQSLATRTCRSRYTRPPSRSSISRRARVPTSLSRLAWWPITIAFWLGRST